MTGLPSAKELAKLAAACRKAGITSFKGGGIEFTMSEATPLAKSSNKRSQAAPAAQTGEPETDELSYDQLLNWSIAPIQGEKTEQ